MAKRKSINMSTKSDSAVKSSKPPEFTPKPAGKSRSKTRKPKYLSLNLQLSSKHKEMTQKQQLNLFPLHPENKIDPIPGDQVSDHVSDDHVAFLFETATDTSTSLRGILDLDSAASTAAAGAEVAPPEGDHQKLVRKAMKRKERDASDDRWVTYREVVEEVSSCSYGGGGGGGKSPEKKGLVGLKLNYEHVLNAWSDKGPLYVRGETPQTVPDLLNDTNGITESEWGNLWKVPEMEKVKIKMEKREAIVLRYKEKRQSRLFAKRIRYQVRKLNAEKRPRLKGRFVKRNYED